LDAGTSATPLRELYGYRSDWARPSATDREAIVALMTATAPQGASATPSPDAVG
jgi:hypothetical protein